MTASFLDPRAAAAWTEFVATGQAESDKTLLRQRLHRPHWSYVYPPPVLRRTAADELAELGTRLAALVVGMPGRVFGDDLDVWMAFLGVPDADAELMRYAYRHPRLRRAATAFMRPDLVLTADGPRLVELNVSTPIGGMSTVDPYAAAAHDSAFAAFLAGRGLHLNPTHAESAWLTTFAELINRRGADRPHVFEAVADPASADSGRRFFVNMIRSGGYDISCGLITDLDLRPDGVFFAGQQISVVVTLYTWYETKRFVPPDLTKALIDLDTAGVIDFIGSPATALFDHKANLELLTTHHDLLDPTDQTLVSQHIPETFRLTESTLDRAMAEQGHLVCKPASAYGGKGLLFGATLDQAQWATHLRDRITHPERYVCQRQVHPTVFDLPGAEPSGREIIAGPLIFGGSPAGLYLRHSPPRDNMAITVSHGAESAAALTLTE
jgi:hypothetical protein